LFIDNYVSAFYWSATKWREFPLAGATQYQAIFLSHQSAAAVTAARQGVSDLNFDGWKTCSSDAVLLESQLKSEL
jgi:hypothetical protein